MSAQAPATPDQELVPRQMTETEGWSAPGIPVVVAGIVLALAAIGLLGSGGGSWGLRARSPRSRLASCSSLSPCCPSRA